MANKLFSEMQQRSNPFAMFGGMQNFMQQLNQLKTTGVDPNQQIQTMLNSGRISQEQYDAAVVQANQLRSFLGK